MKRSPSLFPGLSRDLRGVYRSWRLAGPGRGSPGSVFRIALEPCARSPATVSELREQFRALGVVLLFADRVGIHRTYIGDVERGERNLGLLNVGRIASALDIKLSALMVEVERQGDT